MGETPATTEDHSLRGPIDRPALITIRDLVDEAEPLATPQLDDFLNPSVLEVSLDNGLVFVVPRVLESTFSGQHRPIISSTTLTQRM